MVSSFNRRAFIGQCGIATLASGTLIGRNLQDDVAPQDKPGQVESNSEQTLPANLVYQFVRAAHLNLQQTREMLQAEPRLIRATWEWGPGDFEMAIDGAAHSGTREIVSFLIDKGAPYTIFAAATLGDLESVKAMVAKFPGIVHSTGPHEIPLIEHAIAGGQPAESVKQFLAERGAVAREKPKDLPTTQEYRQSVIGDYKLTAQGQTLEFRIYVEGDKLFIDAGRMGTSRLQYQGQDIFQLEGTPAQITFEHKGQQAVGAMLREGAPIGRATRIEE